MTLPNGCCIFLLAAAAEATSDQGLGCKLLERSDTYFKRYFSSIVIHYQLWRDFFLGGGLGRVNANRAAVTSACFSELPLRPCRLS